MIMVLPWHGLGHVMDAALLLWLAESISALYDPKLYSQKGWHKDKSEDI
jgi:hypothetical protein